MKLKSHEWTCIVFVLSCESELMLFISLSVISGRGNQPNVSLSNIFLPCACYDWAIWKWALRPADWMWFSRILFFSTTIFENRPISWQEELLQKMVRSEFSRILKAIRLNNRSAGTCIDSHPFLHCLFLVYQNALDFSIQFANILLFSVL